jgi:predicted transcriptional regulator
MEKNINISLPFLKKGRGRWEIIRDILTAIHDEKKVKKTRLMQKAYLDWRTFNRYFEYLIKDGFLTDFNDNESFALTNKGRELLERLKDVEDVLDHT